MVERFNGENMKRFRRINKYLIRFILLLFCIIILISNGYCSDVLLDEEWNNTKTGFRVNLIGYSNLQLLNVDIALSHDVSSKTVVCFKKNELRKYFIDDDLEIAIEHKINKNLRIGPIIQRYHTGFSSYDIDELKVGVCLGLSYQLNIGNIIFDPSIFFDEDNYYSKLIYEPKKLFRISTVYSKRKLDDSYLYKDRYAYLILKQVFLDIMQDTNYEFRYNYTTQDYDLW